MNQKNNTAKNVEEFFEQNKERKILLETRKKNEEERTQYITVTLQDLWDIAEHVSEGFALDMETTKILQEWKVKKDTRFIEAMLYLEEYRYGETKTLEAVSASSLRTRDVYRINILEPLAEYRKKIAQENNPEHS